MAGFAPNDGETFKTKSITHESYNIKTFSLYCKIDWETILNRITQVDLPKQHKHHETNRRNNYPLCSNTP